MKTVALLLIIGTSLAVPIEKSEDLQRFKKSLSFKAPCSAAPIVPMGLYAAPSAPIPQYREMEHKIDDHQRSYYETPSAASASAVAAHAAPSYQGAGAIAPSGGYSGAGIAIPSGPVHAQAPSSAVGLFPNARVGGCNIPLLLSCAPNVITGHLAESHGYAAPAYRNTPDFMREADWAHQARAASHHKISEDYPEPQQGNHHTISKDYPEPNLTRIVPLQHHQNEEAAHAINH